MNYRILEYSKEIIDKAIDKEKIKRKGYKIPAIYSIVLYTGSQKWNVEKVLEDKQETLEGIGKRGISEYEVIDINNYTEKELMEKEGILSKIMLLEKSRTERDLIEKINKIVNEKYEKEEKELLERILYYIVSSKLTKKESDEILKKLEEKKEEKGMVAEEILRKSWDREYRRGKLEGRKEGREKGIAEGRKKGIAEGREEGREKGIVEGREEGRILEGTQIIVELLKNNVNEDIIIKVSGVTKRKMNEIKKKYLK